MEYNTQQRKLPLPEYGRSVQNMVDYALTIADRAERQRCANTIVNIMGGMFPHLRDVNDYNHKLWDHLAIMADFKLDIDYPVEVVKKESLEISPDRIPYPQHNVKYRHYGRFVQELILIAANYPEGEERKRLVRLIAIQMKKNYQNWNKDGVEDQKIIDDLIELSDGKIRPTTQDVHVNEPRIFPHRRPMNNNRQTNNNRQGNSQQRKRY